eukprot:COSAG05_NODE_516_length_9068_cov_203.461144_3_plen_57_part_00
MMIEFRSDHACMIQNSETDRMRARGQACHAPNSSYGTETPVNLRGRSIGFRVRLLD